MKKTILVSAERGETRVAVLEAKTKGGKAGASPSSTSSAAAAARSSATSTRARSTTSCPGWRPPSSTSAWSATASSTSTRSSCPAASRRRSAAAARGRRINELIKPGPGDPRPGGQGPAEDEGRAALDERLDRRPLPGLRAAGQRRRRQPPARRHRARPAAQDGRPHLQRARAG